MKIEFKNTTGRLGFLCYVLDIRIAWINPWVQLIKSKYSSKNFQWNSFLSASLSSIVMQNCNCIVTHFIMILWFISLVFAY